MKGTRFHDLVNGLRDVLAGWPDRRQGKNLSYAMADFGLSAFSVFFTQSPSFLAHQKALQAARGKNNAQSFFHIAEIPSDNQVRQMLDPVPPQSLYPVYDQIYERLREHGIIQSFRGVNNSTLIALDGTWYHSSKKIHCPCCSHLEHANGEITYYHSAVTPVIVAPGQSEVIALRPEFITPQDGHTKQDCEIAAAKRWLEQNATRYLQGPVTLLGDDLYAHQPFCRRTLLHGYHFLFTCQPESHATLYQWVNLLQPGPDLGSLKLRVKAGSQWHTHTYRWARQVPLAEGEGALKVNWCELSVTDQEGTVLYRNAWITDWAITGQNVAALAASGRARWKIENENNNTLKTKGYHLEHNFGHGKKHLSSLLAALNILAFLCHTVLAFTDERYRLVRAALPTRQTFFQDVRALTRYLCFPSWEGLLRFMMRGLEIGPYAKPA
ncbi:MAG: ISNCY family transposase [Pseudomonadota bacterium]